MTDDKSGGDESIVATSGCGDVVIGLVVVMGGIVGVVAVGVGRVSIVGIGVVLVRVVVVVDVIVIVGVGVVKTVDGIDAIS